MFSGRSGKQQYFHLEKEKNKSLAALYCLALGELNRENQLVRTSTAVPLVKYLNTSISSGTRLGYS